MNENSQTALRQHLQRAEVRLSTLHRIAGSFLGGAGLFVLLPVFFRDHFTDIGTTIYRQAMTSSNRTAILIWASVTIGACAFVPILAVAYLYLDLLTFYFAKQLPWIQGLLNDAPFFTLTPPPLTENPEIREALKEHLTSAQLRSLADFNDEGKALETLESRAGLSIPRQSRGI